ncbi:phage antirepressor KilAC domain-containing protein [Paenibacillus sp. IHBB 3054]|uniref:phage antirepressor KilAC domain-containing protein n=1 Tax=Paenibacillus sp. IHBB 3054 TaxID=3425689 RepID=UPI003F661F1B
MNNQPTIFNHPEFGEVRTIDLAGKTHFVGNDVAKSLDYVRPYEAVSAHCKGAVSYRVLTSGGEQEAKVVPEGDVYRLIVKAADQSRSQAIKAKAERFERWIFEEVLPSIRKTGMYAADELLDNPDLLIEAATKLKEERAARRALEVKVEKDKPKVLYAESVEVSSTTILIGELAKLLKQNGIDIGQNRLFKVLRSRGFLGTKGDYYNMPTQRAMDLELFEIRSRTINNLDGSSRITRTTKVTGKGQIYFINKFKGEGWS